MQDTIATFTYNVANENGDTLYSKDFPRIFTQGLGLSTPTPLPTVTAPPNNETNWVPYVIAILLIVFFGLLGVSLIVGKGLF